MKTLFLILFSALSLFGQGRDYLPRIGYTNTLAGGGGGGTGPDTNYLTFAMVGADYDGLPNGTTTNNIIDRSTNALTGTMITGTPFATNAISVKGLQFNGSTFMQYTSVLSMRIANSNEMTIAIRHLQFGSAANNGVVGYFGGLNEIDVLGTFADTLYWDFSDISGGRISVAQPGGWDDVWHTLIVRRKSDGTQDVSVDGTELVTGSKSGQVALNSVGSLNIGANGGNSPSSFLSGIIRHVRVYRVWKDNTERTALNTWMGAN